MDAVSHRYEKIYLYDARFRCCKRNRSRTVVHASMRATRVQTRIPIGTNECHVQLAVTAMSAPLISFRLTLIPRAKVVETN